MSAADLVLAGRAAAEEIMVDACIVDRVATEALDTATGQMVTTYTDVYTGKCRIQQVLGTQSPTPDAGEHKFTILSHVVQLPIDATTYQVGDRVRMTAAALDPALVGRAFRVQSLMHKTHPTSRRLVCDEVTA